MVECAKTVPSANGAGARQRMPECLDEIQRGDGFFVEVLKIIPDVGERVVESDAPWVAVVLFVGVVPIPHGIEMRPNGDGTSGAGCSQALQYRAVVGERDVELPQEPVSIRLRSSISASVLSSPA